MLTNKNLLSLAVSAATLTLISPNIQAACSVEVPNAGVSGTYTINDARCIDDTEVSGNDNIGLPLLSGESLIITGSGSLEHRYLESGANPIRAVDFASGAGSITINEGGSLSSVPDNGVGGNPIGIGSYGGSLTSIVNNGSVTANAVSGGVGINASNSAITTITNTGSIAGFDSTIALVNASTSSTLDNSGTLEALTPVLIRQSSSLTSLINSGGITAVDVGPYGRNAAVEVASGASLGTLTNTADGTIRGGNPANTGSVWPVGSFAARPAGILFDGASGTNAIENSGEIAANTCRATCELPGNSGVMVQRSTVEITNSTTAATISGDTGIFVSSSDEYDSNEAAAVTVNNSGVISGEYGIALFAEKYGRDVSLTLTNIGPSSAVTGTKAGIFIVGAEKYISGTLSDTRTVSITNAGTLSGGALGAIHIADTARLNAVTPMSITNSGTITGGIIAPDIAPDSPYTGLTRIINIMNSGSISGGFSFGNHTTSVALSGDGTVAGSITGANTTFDLKGTLSTQAVIDVGEFIVSSGAALRLNHDVTAQFQNTFVNNGTVEVTATNDRAITGSYEQSATGVLKVGMTSPSVFGSLTVSGFVTALADLKIEVVGTEACAAITAGTYEGVLIGNGAGGVDLDGNGFATVVDNCADLDFTAQLGGLDGGDYRRVDLVVASAGPTDTDGDGTNDGEDSFPNADTETSGEGVTLTTLPADEASSCSINESSFDPNAQHPQPDSADELIPLGRAVAYTLTGCASGETIQVSIDFGEGLPAGAQAYKVDNTTGWSSPIVGATINDGVVTYSITDGGDLDQDGEANGTIVDPVSVASPMTPTVPVPTLPLSMLGLLGLLSGLLGFNRLRKQS